jgi:hypothetical protein
MERIKETESPQVIVDVHSRGLIRRRRADHEAPLAAAIRWATRGVTGFRLASATEASRRGQLEIAAKRALTLSAHLYRTVATDHAAVAAATCQALANEIGEPSPGAIPRRFWPGTNNAAGASAGIRPADPPAQVSAAEAWFVADAPRESAELS